MRKVLFDTNVVLDVLLDRQPHVEASAAAWAGAESGVFEGVLAAHAITTIHYLVQNAAGATKARKTIAGILQVFRVAPVDGTVIRDAMQLAFTDFEDAVTAASAASAGCSMILTRNPKDFRNSPVQALMPRAAAPILHL